VKSEEFAANADLRQGDALSLIIFNIALESIRVREVLQNEQMGLNSGQGKQIVLAAYAA